MMKAKFLIPFAIFVVLAGFLFKGLYLDPRALPSVLINKPLPTFELPTLFDPTQKFSTEEMKGKVWMLKLVPALQGGAPLSCRAEALGPEDPDCGLPL